MQERPEKGVGATEAIFPGLWAPPNTILEYKITLFYFFGGGGNPKGKFS
jgi:hypothetical protein